MFLYLLSMESLISVVCAADFKGLFKEIDYCLFLSLKVMVPVTFVLAGMLDIIIIAYLRGMEELSIS